MHWAKRPTTHNKVEILLLLLAIIGFGIAATRPRGRQKRRLSYSAEDNGSPHKGENELFSLSGAWLERKVSAFSHPMALTNVPGTSDEADYTISTHARHECLDYTVQQVNGFLTCLKAVLQHNLLLNGVANDAEKGLLPRQKREP